MTARGVAPETHENDVVGAIDPPAQSRRGGAVEGFCGQG